MHRISIKKIPRLRTFLLDLFGIFYVTIALLAFYTAITLSGLQSVFWLSYFAFLLIGVGILTRNAYLIGSQIAIVFIPYLVWAIDFVYVLFTNQSLWGITNYVFTTSSFISLIITLQHLFIVPVGLAALASIKFKKTDFWKLSVAQVAVLFIIARLFSDSHYNINCVFRNCLPFDIQTIYYPLAWFSAFVLMIGLVSFVLTKMRVFNHNLRHFS